MKRKILVVDDEDDILHFLELVLKEKGYDVVTASNGHDALTAAQIEKPESLTRRVTTAPMAKAISRLYMAVL